MADPYIGEIRMFAGTYTPKGYASCDGQILSIAQNTALFSILGTTYGGNGQTTFALPDLRGRAPMHRGAGPGLTDRTLGEKSGQESTTLMVANLPPHSHALRASSQPASEQDPTGHALALARTAVYASGPPTAAMHVASVGSSGGGQPHDNMQPYLALRFIIALFGLFPPHS